MSTRRADLVSIRERHGTEELFEPSTICGWTRLHVQAHLDRGTLLEEVDRLTRELADAQHWRERHCKDAGAYGAQSQKNWEEVCRLRTQLDWTDAENARMRALLEPIACWGSNLDGADHFGVRELRVDEVRAVRKELGQPE